MNLALKYRPKDFSDIVGQKATCAILSAMIATNSLEQVLLFTGPSGTGKTSMARIVAAKLNPGTEDLVHELRHPAVIEIDAASNGSVDSIRELKRSLNYVMPGNKVVILDEAHAMSDEAKTALLKILEFPPPYVTFILITTESHKIPRTIRHRCDNYAFKLATINELVERLNYVNSSEGMDTSPDLLNLIAQRSEGSYRESLMLLNQVAIAGITTVQEYNDLQGEVDYGPSLVESFLGGPVSAVNQLDVVLSYSNTEEIVDNTISTLKDLMLLKGGISLTHSGIALESRVRLASRLDSGLILKAMRIIWDLQTKLTTNYSIRSLELVFSLIGELLQVKTSVPVIANDKPLSFEELQRQRG